MPVSGLWNQMGFSQGQESCGLLTIDLNKKIYRCLSVPFFSWIGIDMVHHFLDLFSRISILCMFFRDDITDQFMVPFTVALLVYIHRITIEYPALDLSGLGGFLLKSIFLASKRPASI